MTDTLEVLDLLEDHRPDRAFVRDVIDSQSLYMAFQPIVDLTSGLLIRREGLIQWHGPGLDPQALTPAQFVIAAERSGQIDRLGRLALEESCRSAARWQHDDPEVGVAVNVSPVQVTPGFVAHVMDTLERYELDPYLLTLELTESSLGERSDVTVRSLRDLAEIGVRVSLDDFGLGYCSMAMMCGLPVAEVKIDRRFCSSIDRELWAVTEAAVGLSHSLGLSVVADGITSIDMRDRLIDLGCESGQGLLFGRAEPIVVPAPVAVGH